MDFGKTDAFADVDYTLPEEPAFNRAVLDIQAPDELQFFIGTTGWSMPEWKGTVYPPTCKSSEFLHYYSSQFNTIEFNTTHYRIPELKTVENWYQKSAEDFKFCPKMPQQISHRKDLGIQSGYLKNFIGNISLLKEKLGPVFVQFPPYFGPEYLGMLQKLVAQIPDGFQMSIELRHPGWFENRDTFLGLAEYLRTKNQGMVITDVAGRRDVLHMHLSSRYCQIRFVGNGLHATDFERVDAWVERIKTWKDGGLNEIYFFAHEPDNLLAPELAAYIYEKIKDLTRVKSRGVDLDKYQKGQQSLFD